MPASVGYVYVDVRFNVGDIQRQLQAALAGAAAPGSVGASVGASIEQSMMQRLTAIGTKMQTVGRQLTTGLTVPLALVGRAATRSFKEFDAAMTQVQALVGVNAERVERWRGEVRELGRTYGVAAEEAAEGLYYITSSGIEGQEAIDVLETSIKGAAVGLGDTKVVADVVTSALNAYGAANITAAQAADQLTVAVRRGKGEADEMAGALSQVIPIAANLDVGFGEVAGAMAAMTLSGTSADQAATQLRGLFNTLQDMPPIAQRALEQYTGLNYQNVRLKLTSEGLVPTLHEVFEAFGENKAALAEVFGNIRAMTGAMNLFGKNTDTTLEIVREVTEASGDLNEAWEITAQSKSKQLELAMNNLHDAFLGVGSELVPMLTKVAGAMGAVASTVDNMPGPLKAAAVGVGVLAAAAGPLVMVAGSLVRAVGSLGQALQNTGRVSTETAASLGSTARSLGTVTAALAAGATAWALYSNMMADAEQRGRDMQELANNISLTGGREDAVAELGKIDGQIAGINKEISEFWSLNPGNVAKTFLAPWSKGADLDYVLKQLPEMRAGLERSKQQIQDRLTLADQLAAKTGKSADAIYKWLAAEEKAGRTHTSADDAYRGYVEGLVKGDEATTKLAESNVVIAGSLEDITNKAKAAGDAFFAVRDAEQAQADAAAKVVDARQKVVDAQDAYRNAQQRTIEADRKVVEAQRKVTEATQATADARQRLADAQQALSDAMRGPSEDERINLESARLGLQEAQARLRGRFDSPLDRRRAQLDVRRARQDLLKAQGEHAERVVDAEKEVRSAQDAVNDALANEVAAQQAVVDARNARADASRNEARAYEDIGRAQQGVRDAERELFDATNNMVTKQGEFNTALMSGTINANWLLEYLLKLRDMYPELAGQIEDYVNRIKAAERAAAERVPKPPDQPAPAPAPVPAPEPYKGTPTPMGEGEYIPGVGYVKKKRASGGPVSRMEPALVAEKGLPELWSARGKQYLIPRTPGQVIPLRPSDLGAAVKGGDTPAVGTVNVYTQKDPVQTAYEVRRQLRQRSRAKGRT